MTLVAAGLAAAAGFVATAQAVRRRKPHAADEKLRRRLPHDATIETPHGRAIEQVQKLGKWYLQGPLTAAAAAVLWRGGHRRAASALAIASASGGLAANLFDEVIFHRPPPPGHPAPDTPSFPSGHAIQLAAVSLTAGYVLMRERLAPAAIAMPLAIGIPLVSSGGRLYQDRHWASDLLGGWLAGIALASWSMGAYEFLDERALARTARRTRKAVERGARATAHAAAEAATTTAAGARTTRRVAERAVARTVERAADARDAAGQGVKTGLLGLAQRVMGQFLVPGMDVEQGADRPLV